MTSELTHLLFSRVSRHKKCYLIAYHIIGILCSTFIRPIAIDFSPQSNIPFPTRTFLIY